MDNYQPNERGGKTKRGEPNRKVKGISETVKEEILFKQGDYVARS